jgi:hypothetical protein
MTALWRRDPNLVESGAFLRIAQGSGRLVAAIDHRFSRGQPFPYGRLALSESVDSDTGSFGDLRLK